MRFLMGSQDVQWPEQLRGWLLNPQITPVLRDVWSWCLEKEETTWGPLDVYVETFLPPSGAKLSRQIDLLLAFNDRAVLCEIKQNRSLQSALSRCESSLDQIQWQDLALEAIRTRIGVGKVSRTVLFFPHLNAEAIETLARAARQSRPHIVVAGGQACAGTTSGFPRYLPKTLDAILGELDTRGREWRGALFQMMDSHNQPYLQPCGSLDETVRFLAQLEQHSDTRLNADQVNGLRAPELAEVARHLTEQNLVEICGAHWTGKSRFIEELVRNHLPAHRVLPFDVLGAVSASGILRQALETADRAHHNLSDAALIEACAQLRVVFWIQSYDRPARAALGALSRQLADRQSPAADDARWVIESIAPVAPSNHQRQLNSLETDQIRELLLRRPPGDSRHDLNRVAYLARGNPGIAAALWRAGTPLPSDDHSRTAGLQQFDWLSSVIPPSELSVLYFVVWVLSTIPCGLSASVLLKVVQHVFADRLPSQLADALQRVLSIIESNQLGHIYHVNEWLLPASLQQRSFAVVNNINADLREEVVKWVAQHPVILDDWKTRASEALDREGQDPLGLAHGARLLQRGELWNFYWHPLRHTHRAHVVRWLDEVNATPLLRDPLQMYVARALRFGQGFSSSGGDPEALDKEVGRPNEGDSRQVAVYESLKYSLIRKLTLTAAEIHEWCRGADDIKDPAIRLPALAYVALAYGQLGQAQEAWAVLKPLLEARDSLHETHRSRVLHSGLAFLNQTKLVGLIRSREPKDYFQALTVQIASELLALAVRCQNVTLLADGFFYLVRSEEFYRSPDVDREQAIGRLHFITTASPARALQAVVTEGSLYRRPCRDGVVPDEEVPTHLAAATRLYEQAYQAASSVHAAVHELNAGSYMGEVALLALRHAHSHPDDECVWLKPILASAHRIITLALADHFSRKTIDATFLRR